MSDREPKHRSGTIPPGLARTGGDRDADLWLQNAARLALGALLARLDLEQGARPFFWVDFRAQPAQAQHSYWDYVDIAGRFMDALVLGRAMTGIDDGREAEALLREFVWAQQDPSDGLFYIPAQGGPADIEMSKYLPDGAGMGMPRHVDMFCQRAPLLAGATLLASGDGSVRPRLQRLIEGLMAISQREGEEVSFPTYRWAPTLKPQWYAGATAPERWLGYRYALLTGLARYVELTGEAQAADLALGLARFYMHRGDVPPDGRFCANTHSGGVMPTTVGIARLGAWAGDRRMLDWAHRVYAWVREQIPDFGFLPDGFGLPGFFGRTCETCALADLQHLAIVLTEAGVGDYWDDIERVARNQLLENQYRDPGRLRQALPGISERVLAMVAGAFEAAAAPNSLLTWDGSEGCCIGGGLRALYLTWRASAGDVGGVTRVNMGFSRSTPGTEIVGHEPWAGLIEVRVRQLAAAPREIMIRLPGHADMQDAQATLDGVPIDVPWRGRYAAFERVGPGQVAAIRYPLREESRGYTVGDTHYRGEWRGHTMLTIDPSGGRYPIYCRGALAEEPDPAAGGTERRTGPVAVSGPVLW